MPATASDFEVTTHLLDGELLLIRAIRPNDKQALREGMQRASPESAYHRFFQPKHDLSDQELVYFTEVDFVHHVALVAVLVTSQLPVGVGRYVILPEEPGRVAELAFAVDDVHQGRGIASLLLMYLADIARAAGLEAFQATVLADNENMLNVLSRSALPQQREPAGDVIDIRLFLSESR